MLFGEAYQSEDIGVMRDQKLRGLEEEFCDTSLYCVKDRNLIEDACKLKKRVDENNKKKLDNFKEVTDIQKYFQNKAILSLLVIIVQDKYYILYLLLIYITVSSI